jgi:NADH-quinone oxidoreductase subunit C
VTVSPEAIFAHLTARLAGAVSVFTPAAPPEVKEGPRDACFRTTPAHLVEVLTCLRDDPQLRFGFLQNLTAIDWPARGPGGQFEVVYHLFSYPLRHEAVLKVEVPRDRPRLPSAAGLWRNAGWLEREQYDLLGVVFEGHPDLRRLLMPDDWVGHPMRKDYREAAEYRGMPTTRPSPMDLLAQHDRAHPKPPTSGS